MYLHVRRHYCSVPPFSHREFSIVDCVLSCIEVVARLVISSALVVVVRVTSIVVGAVVAVAPVVRVARILVVVLLWCPLVAIVVVRAALVVATVALDLACSLHWELLVVPSQFSRVMSERHFWWLQC